MWTIDPWPSIVQNTFPKDLRKKLKTDLQSVISLLWNIPGSLLETVGFIVKQAIPSGNVGEVSWAKASSEELSFIAIICFYREISLLKDNSTDPPPKQKNKNHT